MDHTIEHRKSQEQVKIGGDDENVIGRTMRILSLVNCDHPPHPLELRRGRPICEEEYCQEKTDKKQRQELFEENASQRINRGETDNAVMCDEEATI